MSVSTRIQRLINRRTHQVFITADFRALGSKSSVRRALASLTQQGLLVRLGAGVYARAKRSVLTGKPIPVSPLEVLAPIALQRLGVTVHPSVRTQAYNDGLTTQVPLGIVVRVQGRRFNRTLSFGRKVVALERM